MQAYVVHNWGDIEQLKLEKIAKPTITDKEVLIRVIAVGLNPIDYIALSGALAGSMQLPAILGWDVAGVVEAVGRGVTSCSVGDHVMGLINFPNVNGTLNSSGFTEFASAPANQFILKPAALSFEQAAALPAVGLTAWQGLHTLAALGSGQRVLIHGAAGGVGHVAVQIAKNAGAFVIATARGEAHTFVKSLGADQVIDYRTQDFVHHAAGVDVVFDTVGGDVLHRSLKVIKTGGTLVTTMWPQLDLIKQAAADRGVQATAVSVTPNTEQLQTLVQQVARGTLQVHVDKVYPFSQLPEALRRLRSGGVQGKLVVRVGNT